MWTGRLFNCVSHKLYYSDAHTNQRTTTVGYGFKRPFLLNCLASKDTTNTDSGLRDSSEVCDNVTSLSISNGAEKTGVTSFVQEACTNVEALGKFYKSPQTITAQSEFQDLKEYFRRPRMIGNGVLSTGTRGNVFNTDVVTDTLFISYFLNGYSRLAGVEGVRFKLVYTVQVAATPFHQGLLALNWQYANAGNSTFRNIAPQSATALPHVRLDLSADTMVQLSVPFMNSREYIDLGNGARAYGRISLDNVLPIASVASVSPPTFKLYVHLEEMVLIGPSPQASVAIAFQSGKKLSGAENEYENEALPISSALHAASRSFSWIAKGVPSLSSIAGPPAWFLGKAAGLVRYFGFSKPQIQDPIIRIYKQSNVCEGNVDLPSATVTVGPMASNHLKIDSTFSATDVDEMAMSYVLSQWSQVCYGTLSTSDAAGSTLYGTAVSPNHFWFRANASKPFCNVKAPSSIVNVTDAINCFYPSNLFYWAMMFKYWRGDIKFRFTFAKTKFHGGRIMAAFIPSPLLEGEAPGNVYGLFNGPEALAGNVQPFGMSAVFDLKDTNVFEFDVPYISNVPFSTFMENTGSLTLTVIDPLQATSSVSSSIPFIVEVCAGSDFELAAPMGPLYPSVRCDSASKIRLQSGKVVSTISPDVSLYTVGEQLQSVKQLAMIPKHFILATQVAGDTTADMNILPWFATNLIPTTVPGVSGNGLPNYVFGWGMAVAACYNFVRGGTDFHLYSASNNNSICFSATYDSYTGGVESTPAAPGNRPPSNKPRVISSSNNSLHVRFPAYQKVIRYLADCAHISGYVPGFNNNGKFNLPLDTNYPALVYSATYDNPPGASVSRIYASTCAADDAQAAFYMGPPYLYLTKDNSGLSWDNDIGGLVNT